DLAVLEDCKKWEPRTWDPFTTAEMMDALRGTSNRSAPGPDKAGWKLWKSVVSSSPDAAEKLVSFANSLVVMGHWPAFLKESNTVVIPKPGKPAYDTPKMFRPIVLLNTLGKLFEKMISNRMQYEAIKYGVLHPNQFGGVRQHSTEDAGVYLTHIVKAGWVANHDTSVLAFDLAQFFPSINHQAML